MEFEFSKGLVIFGITVHALLHEIPMTLIGGLLVHRWFKERKK